MAVLKRKQRQPSAVRTNKRQKQKGEREGIETDQFFIDSDNEAEKDAGEDEITETAEEKRLRLGECKSFKCSIVPPTANLTILQ